jgi:FkbM family methyltransferase
MVLTQVVLNFGSSDKLQFLYRDKSKSDKGVIHQIFIKKHYEMTRLSRSADIISEYLRILSLGRTSLIIDCGANIGASPFWFAKSFPNARIYALEPEAHNYELLQLNCGSFPNITSERGAISCRNETLYVEDPGGGDWGFRTTANPGLEKDSAPAYSIASIQRRFEATDLFLVKIDVEGGEPRLFESNCEWIQQTMVIIIELHDWLLPKSASSQNFSKALSQYNRDFVIQGDNVFSIRNGAPAIPPSQLG